MNAIVTTLRQVYKPILPHQIRSYWETEKPGCLIDFVGQKYSFFFSDLRYAENLASRYANELNKACFVLAFDLESASHQFIGYCKRVDKNGLVVGIATGHLDSCFPEGWAKAKIVSVCQSEDQNQLDLFNGMNRNSAAICRFKSWLDKSGLREEDWI